MAIDDPLDASEKQLEAEERESSPLARFIPNLVQLGQVFPSMIVPFADVTKTVLAAVNFWVSKTAADRRNYLVTTLGQEVRRMRDRFEALDDSHQQFIKDEFLSLVVDGLQKAEQTRSKQRIRRIAAILAHALDAGPSRPADTTEEMMRIATLLSDDDVVVLRALYEGQKSSYQSQFGRVGWEQANDFWRLLDPMNRSPGDREVETLRRFTAGELHAICVKLQSLGLVAQVQRDNMKLSPGLTPYAILVTAKHFVEYIGNVETDLAAESGVG